MTVKTWDAVETVIQQAILDGYLADYRKKLKRHPTKTFRRRTRPADILGVCSHHGASANQDPQQMAQYHAGPNHISPTGCPGINYTAVISDTIEPEKVILCHDPISITWSQGVGDDSDHPQWSGDENRHLISVCVLGDFSEFNRRGKSGDPTTSQILRWTWFTTWCEEIFGFNGLGYFGHYHFGKAHCPGQAIRRQIECQRAGHIGLIDDRQWQLSLLKWDKGILPKHGPDGDWGYESKRALLAFEAAHKHRIDGIQDPFTELLLLRKYPPVA